MTWLLFVLLLAILILSHEIGHFSAAKVFGVKVEEFGLGFPPRLFGFKKGETLYSLNLFPIGGFVKILGENSQEDTNKPERNFIYKPAYVKASILIAGVFFNLILAWLLFSIIFLIGAPTITNSESSPGNVVIVDVQPGTPAESIGLEKGDQILSLSFNSGGNQEKIKAVSIKKIQNFIERHKGKQIEIEIMRQNSILKKKAIPKIYHSPEKGALGIAMAKIQIVSYGFPIAFWKGFQSVVLFIKETIKALIFILSSLVKGENKIMAQIMGPVGIAALVGSAINFGFVNFLQLAAILAINLAIINIFPFPALDGGRLIFVLIEKIKGSPLNQKFIAIVNNIGFILLIFLMLLITYKDILRVFG